jgi:superfamily II DNA or RNA helicase
MSDHPSNKQSCDSKLFAELRSLRAENDRLKALLTQNGIAWQEDAPDTIAAETPLQSSTTHGQQLSTAEKVSLFRRLFQGREDVYPVRWESSAKGTSGYAPACGNDKFARTANLHGAAARRARATDGPSEWKPGICKKPRIKCADCEQRLLLPVTDQVIFDHLSGHHTIGVYPLLADDTCYFLAVDFDKADWRDDARAFMTTCSDLDLPASLEISRSGHGAHVWIFFAEAVPARDARRLGAALISRTCATSRQLTLQSYDRLFPNQDTLPKGGFGNLIALPLQKKPRDQGHSLFVDENFAPYPDQWHFLGSMRFVSRVDMEAAIHKATGGGHPLDVAFISEEDEREPWQRPAPLVNLITGTLPESLTLVLANQIFIAKEDLPQPLANRLIRLAAFQNPEFYKAQAMRLAVWNKPPIIGCAENFPQHIGLPRGCLDAVQELLTINNISIDIQDERISGRKIGVKFVGKLRRDQKAAVKETMNKEIGVLCAPTAFGKTVTAAAIIARRKVSTLILVHRTELMRQWQERLSTFLTLAKGALGAIGGGKNKPLGVIDIAVMQSLSRREDLTGLLDGYGQIIVDECHHISAFSFEKILKQAKAKYVLGLTATPIRRDGHQPIIFMQCGPIRHNAARPDSAPAQLEVWAQKMPAPVLLPEAEIQEVLSALVHDKDRIRRIVQDIRTAYGEGRKVIVLTERTTHLDLLREELGEGIENCFVLHGRMKKKERKAVLDQLAELEGAAPRILLATGRLVGEGFDHPPLDTLVLAMPISWKGTIQQYAGRLHREHASKQDVRIYDYVEQDNIKLSRMWDKRQRGYRAMGYQIQILE